MPTFYYFIIKGAMKLYTEQYSQTIQCLFVRNTLEANDFFLKWTPSFMSITSLRSGQVHLCLSTVL